MGFCNTNMILRLLWLAPLLHCLNCNPQRLALPNFEASPPEEVNSGFNGLFLQQPRSIYHQNSKTGAVRSRNNIEDTVREVENMIKANPSLPRLTRGEILDLLENITKQDLGKLRDPKAIMVVMPFTPQNSDSKNMEDLFTKAPITQIIGNEEENSKDKIRNTHRRRRPPVKYPAETGEEVSDNSIVKYSVISSSSSSTTTTTEHPTTIYTTPTSAYTSTTIRHHNRRRRPLPDITTSTTTELPRPVRTRRPLRRRTTTTTRHPNHKYPDDYVEVTTRRGDYSPSDGIRIVESPNLGFGETVRPAEDRNEEVSDDFPPIITTRRPMRFRPASTTTSTALPLPVITTRRPPRVTTNKDVIDDLELPSRLKGVVHNFDLSALDQKDTEPELRGPSIEEQNKIKELLASIGALPISPTTTTTSTAIPNAANVAESLSPEMRDLLMSFGLLPNPNPKTPSPRESSRYVPDTAEVRAESYVGFKPLPDDDSSRDDMDALLASFGLGRNSRRQKKLKNPSQAQINNQYNFDIIPDHLKPVIAQLGLANTKRDDKKISSASKPKQKNVEKQSFNPDTQYATQEELDKLGRLLDIIKQLEKMNGTANEEELNKIDLNNLKELVGSLNGVPSPFVTLDQRANSPDPNSFDPGLTKNEVKRQETSTTTAEAITSISASSTTTTTTTSTTAPDTEEPRNGPTADLEASFGGQTETPAPETTTANTKTGFYYLVDWNTFLDIDDQKGKRVNLRFQPTIGDPKRFLSVTVP